MFYPKSIHLSCVYLLIFFLAFVFPKAKTQTSCGNSTCGNKSTNFLKTFWNKSMEVTFYRYKMKLISITKCKVPDGKADPTHPVEPEFKIKRVNRETTTFDVDARVNKTVGPLLFTIRGYVINQNSLKDLIYKIDRVPCTHSLIQQLTMVVKIKLDKCMLEEGVHQIRNIDMDNFSGVLSPTFVYPGIYSYELEFYHSKGIVACESLNTQVTERRKSKP